MASLSNSFDSLRGWWQTATPMTRAAASGMLLTLIVGLIVAVSLASTPDFVPIYHGLSGKEAAGVEKVLQGANIAYKLSDKGATVSVASKDESNATVAIEAAGILSKDAEIPGIESLDKISLGTSTDVEREKILAANEGELSRRLRLLEPVQDATVSIAPGSSSSLFGNDAPPTASVILTLKQGETLNSTQVKGVVGLISHAVSGLTPQNVALTDQTGAQLYKGDSFGNNIADSSQPIEANAKFADQERVRLQGILDDMLGPHKARVTVNAELDFDQTQIDSLQHTPVAGTKTGLPVSVQDKEETYTGAGAPPVGGAAGTGSNLNAPSYPGGSGSGGSGNFKSVNTTTNYENDITHTVVQKTPGAVRKESVAAFVDSSIPADTLPKIKDFMSTAIGVTASDPSRFVTVQQIAIDTSAQKALQSQMKAAQTQQLMGNVARALAVCLVVGMLFFLMLRAGRPAAPRLALSGAEGGNIGLLENADSGELEAMLEERPLRVEDVLAEMPEVMPRSSKRRMQAPSIEEQQNLKLESIQDMIEGSPESVALLLKGWMAEEAKVS